MKNLGVRLTGPWGPEGKELGIRNRIGNVVFWYQEGNNCWMQQISNKDQGEEKIYKTYNNLNQTEIKRKILKKKH